MKSCRLRKEKKKKKTRPPLVSPRSAKREKEKETQETRREKSAKPVGKIHENKRSEEWRESEGYICFSVACRQKSAGTSAYPEEALRVCTSVCFERISICRAWIKIICLLSFLGSPRPTDLRLYQWTAVFSSSSSSLLTACAFWGVCRETLPTLAVSRRSQREARSQDGSDARSPAFSFFCLSSTLFPAGHAAGRPV